MRTPSKEEQTPQGGIAGLGEIKVTALVTMFKKIKFDTHETLGFGHVQLPETDMHTTSMWWTLPEKLAAKIPSDQLKNGMMGIANLLRIYDNTPGGIGLSHKAFGMKELLLSKALQVAEDCPCAYGCPSCVGPVGEVGEDGKRTAIRLLKELTK